MSEFDKQVNSYIIKCGTYTNTIEGRVFHIEADCYRADNSPDGYIAWWDDDHGHKTLGRLLSC
jgi:hypothetical protein